MRPKEAVESTRPQVVAGARGPGVWVSGEAIGPGVWVRGEAIGFFLPE